MKKESSTIRHLSQADWYEGSFPLHAFFYSLVYHLYKKHKQRFYHLFDVQFSQSGLKTAFYNNPWRYSMEIFSVLPKLCAIFCRNAKVGL